MIGARLEADADGSAEGDGEYGQAVIVDVLADQVHPPRREGGDFRVMTGGGPKGGAQRHPVDHLASVQIGDG